MISCSAKCRHTVRNICFRLLFVLAGMPALAHPPGGPPVQTKVFTTGQGRTLQSPANPDDVFHFVIYGDRTGGVPAGLEVLKQAVEDTALLDPDLVMTVGDLVQGYNETPQWLEQTEQFQSIMDRLPMPWYPVAGNHDIYWRGSGPPPQGHHEQNYQKQFGPLWYAMRHKSTGFIALYSDEGDPETNRKGFSDAKLQRMSEQQMSFLDQALEKLSDCRHVFVFLHHPRWIAKRYGGGNWDSVHEKLKQAGNVHAVFAGHIHRMQYGGVRDGIAYYALATTGGHLRGDFPAAGYLHHFNMVTVRPDSFSVAAIPVGAVIDPTEFTDQFLADIDAARGVQPEHQSGALKIAGDGSVQGELTYQLSNTGARALETTITLQSDNGQWVTTFDHRHATLQPGQSESWTLSIDHPPGFDWRVPRLLLQAEMVGETAAVALPVTETPLVAEIAPMVGNQWSDDYPGGTNNRCLRVLGESSAVRVDSKDFSLPDGPLTVEAWVKPDSSSGYSGLLTKTQSSEYGLFYDEGSIDFSVHLDGKYVRVESSDPLPLDRMTHVAGVYDGREIRLYIAGKLVAQEPAQGKRTVNKLPLWIGADPGRDGQASRAFVGLIDEVRLSSAAVYTGPTFEPERRQTLRDDTVLLFHLDRRWGPFQIDQSSRHVVATMMGNAELILVPSVPSTTDP